MGVENDEAILPSKLIDALDDVAIRGAKPRERDYKKYDGRGLYLLVRTNGARHWRLKYRLGGRERLLALGEYPDTTLKAAREKASSARELVRQGLDPVQQARALRAERIAAAMQTFEVVAAQWVEKKRRKWTAGHIEQTRQSLADYVLPKIGKRAIASITAQDVTAVLDPLERARKLETLRRVRQRVSAVLSFAVQIGLRPDNPVVALRGAYEAPDRTHFASLKPAELGAFLSALGAYQGHLSTVGIIRMILWTASRTGEIRGARRGEFDLAQAVWTVPGERMKRRRPHVVPLPMQAVVMLRKHARGLADDDLMFPSPLDPSRIASENIVLQALKKMGYAGRVTGHGLRATVATGLEEMGFPLEVVKAQLSHAKDTLTDAAYLRGVHLDRRRHMMQAWADNLDEHSPSHGVARQKAAH